MLYNIYIGVLVKSVNVLANFLLRSVKFPFIYLDFSAIFLVPFSAITFMVISFPLSPRFVYHLCIVSRFLTFFCFSRVSLPEFSLSTSSDLILSFFFPIYFSLLILVLLHAFLSLPLPLPFIFVFFLAFFFSLSSFQLYCSVNLRLLYSLISSSLLPPLSLSLSLSLYDSSCFLFSFLLSLHHLYFFLPYSLSYLYTSLSRGSF